MYPGVIVHHGYDVCKGEFYKNIHKACECGKQTTDQEMATATTSSDTDKKTIMICAGVLIAGVLVGAFVVAPMIQKFKDKKKKTDTTAKT